MTIPSLSIVVPVYNEGASIEAVLRGLESAVAAPHETLIVYDFDEDDTLPVVNRLTSEMPALRLLPNTLGPGVRNAIVCGMRASRAPWVLVTMADGSDDPGVIDGMLEKAERGPVIVTASRYMRGGSQIGGPRLKSLLSRTAGLTAHWIAGLPVHDPTNSFKLYQKRFLDSVEVESTKGFSLGLELTVKAFTAGHQLDEVPAVWRDRTHGTSRFDLRGFLPTYLPWYVKALRYGLARRARRIPGRAAS